MKNVIGCGFTILMIVLIIAFVGLTLASFANGTIAVNDAGKVSQDLGHELSVAQRTTNDEVQRLQGVARANQSNADSNRLNADANKLNADATRTIEEAKTIRDERESKKIGYGGLMLKDFFGSGGGTCIILLILFLFFGGLIIGKMK